MNRRHTPSDEPWENDQVWDLIDQSPPRKPSGQFVDDTVRAARLSGHPRNKAWAWGTLAAGLLGATAALVISLLPEASTTAQPPRITSDHSPRAQEIEEIAQTEALIAAVEHMDQFSDNELVALIGF